MSELMKMTVDPVDADVTVPIPLCALHEFYELLERACRIATFMENATTQFPKVPDQVLSMRYKVASINIAMAIQKASGELPAWPE